MILQQKMTGAAADPHKQGPEKFFSKSTSTGPMKNRISDQ
jgi:hypothetical protein